MPMLIFDMLSPGEKEEFRRRLHTLEKAHGYLEDFAPKEAHQFGIFRAAVWIPVAATHQVKFKLLQAWLRGLAKKYGCQNINFESFPDPKGVFYSTFGL